jgi:SulP family sulfate permease
VDHVQGTLQEIAEKEPERKHLLLIGNGINFVDIAGAEMLVQEAQRRRTLGGGLYLAKVKEEVCNIFKRGDYGARFGRENVFASKTDAIASLVGRLDGTVCAGCERRIFRECAQAAAQAQSAAA